MCTGLEMAAMAAMAAGSYMQYESAESKADATRRAANAEALRQGEIDRGKNQRWQDSLAEFDRDSQEGNLDEATAAREALMKEVVAEPQDGDGTFSPGSAASRQPKVIQDYADRRQDEADDFVSALGNARARLGAWGEGKFAPAEALSELGFDLGEFNTQAARSGEIGAREAQLAGAETGNEMALAGNLMSGLGSAGMGYAGQQAAAGSPANYQGAGFAGSAGSFADDYRASGLGRNFYNSGGGGY